MHSKDERVRTEWSRRLRAPRASGRSSYPCACLRRPSVLAQSANQVLSEVLSDPPALLSASPRCASHIPMITAVWLCGLLILLGLFGEFDGEQGLHAGVRVRRFHRPSETDRLGVGVLEALSTAAS